MGAVVSRIGHSITKDVFFDTSHTVYTAKRLLADIRGLAPDIAARAAKIEAGRRVALDLLEALRPIGVFRIFEPHWVAAIKKVYSAIGRRRLAAMAVGAGFFATSVSSFGADLATGSSRSITGPLQVMRTDHRPMAAQSSAPADTKLDHLAAHVRMVDRLYEELMRWTPPCSPASTEASMAGRC
jgi:hypothetical protein